MQESIPTTRLPAPAEVTTAVLAVSEAKEHMNTIFSWGKIMAQSGFFKDAREAAQAAVKIQAGYELGMQPAASMRNVYVFDGQIALSYPAMAAKVNQSSNYEFEVVEKSNDKVVIKWSGKSKRTGQWRDLGTSEFSQADVVTAGLQNKDNHKKFPLAMKLARAMSQGCKMYCPELFNGSVYVPEELTGSTVVMDGEGNVLSVEAPPPSGARSESPKQNVTPITTARSAAKPAPASTQTPGAFTRLELMAEVRTLFGIKKASLNAAEAKIILTDFQAVLGREFKSITALTDEELLAYVNRKKAPAPVAGDPGGTIDAAPATVPAGRTQQTNATLFAVMSDIGVRDKSARLAFANYHKFPVTSFTELSERDALALIEVARALQKSGVTEWVWPAAPAAADPAPIAAVEPDVVEPAAAVDELYYCDSCGVPIWPEALAKPHEASCEIGFPDEDPDLV
jgi:hypothetical protein